MFYSTVLNNGVDLQLQLYYPQLNWMPSWLPRVELDTFSLQLFDSSSFICYCSCCRCVCVMILLLFYILIFFCRAVIIIFRLFILILFLHDMSLCFDFNMQCIFPLGNINTMYWFICLSICSLLAVFSKFFEWNPFVIKIHSTWIRVKKQIGCDIFKV